MFVPRAMLTISKVALRVNVMPYMTNSCPVVKPILESATMLLRRFLEDVPFSQAHQMMKAQSLIWQCLASGPGKEVC